ncbi:MAG: hypothetical protein GTN70_10010 [Deltaproteobacteria bacterium]|nr:hypothetical protein [Deltaproteobacteria bacterium]
MYICVSNIPPEGYQVQKGQTPGVELDFEGRELFPLDTLHVTWVEFNVSISGKDLILAGNCGGDISYSCDRCGEHVTRNMDISFNKIFESYEMLASGGDHQLQREDLEITFFDGEGFYLEDVIYEHLVLSLPQQILCTDECKGLCQVCGMNLNRSSCSCKGFDVDPRLEKLKSLRSKME